MDTPLQVLIAEKSHSLAGLLVRYLEQANFSVAVVDTLEGALKAVAERHPEAVLSTVSRFDGEHLARRLRKLDRTVSIGLLYPPNRAADAEPSCRMNGGDLALLGPVQEATLVSSIRLLIRLHRQAKELAQREAPPSPVPLPEDAPPDLATLKRILAMEVKKSRRYKYPASFLLAELDGWNEKASAMPRDERSRVIGLVLLQFTQALRDIDLCVHASNERFIVFLPHTPHDGARVVASRLHARIRALPGLGLTASVGVASYNGQGQASFGSLLKDATLALRRAKLAGGDRIELHDLKRPDRVFIA